MADRKVLNKYYPPDFDPDKLWKNKRYLKDTSNKVKGFKPRKQFQYRMMFPFTICCDSCSEFTYVGTKFNSRAEKIEGEDYLGIEIWRFYGRCPNCRNEIAFKTDPKNGDYTLEFGGTRTYDAAKDNEKALDAIKLQKENDLAGDRMKQIEEKTYSTQRELQTLEDLDEIRQLNRQFLDRNSASDQALEFLKKNSQKSDKHQLQESLELEQFRRTVQEKDLNEETFLDSLTTLDDQCNPTIQSNKSSGNIHKNIEESTSTRNVHKPSFSFFNHLDTTDTTRKKFNIIKKRPAETTSTDINALSNLLEGYSPSEDSN